LVFTPQWKRLRIEDDDYRKITMMTGRRRKKMRDIFTPEQKRFETEDDD
jgi:hypothetical protein